MKLGVFVSWSGERSKLLARVISWWLPRVLSGVRPWMSEKDIHKGERWSHHVGFQLDGHRVGIICVTPENTSSPWLLFEAGAISKAVGDAKVCPLLLGIREEDLEGPLTQFQATVFDREEMFALVASLNKELGDDCVEEPVLRDSFDKFWPELENRVRSIARIAISPQSVPLVVRTFANHGLPEPEVGSAVHFSSGFESHAIYATACSVAAQRLFVFGRKNRKLFDKEHADFFSRLPGMIADKFDFRCLFLNPNSPEHVLSAAHHDGDFPAQLETAIRNAMRVMAAVGVEPDRHCRTYSIQRSVSAVTVDDAVLYARIRFGADGKTGRLTKSPFTVINAQSPLGQELTDEFLDLWDSGQPLSSSLG